MQTRTTPRSNICSAGQDTAGPVAEDHELPYDERLPFQRRHLPEGVGVVLREARNRGGASRKKIAASSGIAPRTLARIERGEQTPLWTTLDRLCDVLGLSVAVIAPRWLKDSFDVPSDGEGAPGPGLRRLREARGMTLIQLAKASGISAATISRFERGLTTSSRLARPVGEGSSGGDRNLVIDNLPLAQALGYMNPGALHRACVEWASTEQANSSIGQDLSCCRSDGHSI